VAGDDREVAAAALRDLADGARAAFGRQAREQLRPPRVRERLGEPGREEVLQARAVASVRARSQEGATSEARGRPSPEGFPRAA
jgi:hypothetical protein